MKRIMSRKKQEELNGGGSVEGERNINGTAQASVDTNFEKLIELVVLCGGADLKRFLDRTGCVHLTYCCRGVHGSSRNTVEESY